MKGKVANLRGKKERRDQNKRQNYLAKVIIFVLLSIKQPFYELWKTTVTFIYGLSAFPVYTTDLCWDKCCAYLRGLVVCKFSDELLSRAAIGGMNGVSVGLRWGSRGGEGVGEGGRRGRGGGGGGLGLQAVEGVSPWGKHHSHPGQEPAPELILNHPNKVNLVNFWEASLSNNKFPPIKCNVYEEEQHYSICQSPFLVTGKWGESS